MILHVDMDAFFASVEVVDRPELAGRPVVVGGSPEGRGVVAAASYAARRYGVHSAMPMATALRLCSQAVVLPVRMGRYAAVSRRIREVFARYTPLVEPVSLDEAFLDVAGSERLFGAAEVMGRRIKAEICAELGLTASVGVAPNKLLAKLASDVDKPDGFVVVRPGEERAFLDPLPVERLWGVGRVGAKALQGLGIRTVGQLRALDPRALSAAFGSQGEHLRALAEGRDDRPVVPDHTARSLSHETTFAADIADPADLRAWLLGLAEQVARRLRRHDLCARTVQVKVRFGDFRTVSRARTLAQPTDLTRTLWRAGREGFEAAWAARGPRGRAAGVRLLGFGVSGLAVRAPRQGDLFEDPAGERQVALDRLSDTIAERFGPGALRRAGGLRRGGS
jgi:DNA polymerase-4